MLLITIYCCSVHVFFLHSALLWWEGVIQESETVTILCPNVNLCDETCYFDDAEKGSGGWMKWGDIILFSRQKTQ